ncbi:hypothetical protein [Anaerostipes sp. MSJ-23]|uniref:hypothetical protein n=1 Tax=Anaerostipes sp. MSJ-23 TaxID=2841520 RepID=UPI001C10FFDF|nr:hypothetical protein [Anaerostipes sp. MSJ-23]MBU5458807.1 hypothetical protein [Anaerostipes sp. MSJ-23]
MKKKIFLTSLLFALIFLCGCGVELTSNVKLDENFSGTRVMSCTFSSNDFKKAFQGNMNDLDNIIESSCPKGMTWKKHTKDEQTVYTFSLSFSSFKDYKEKVADILNFSPKITWKYNDSPFVSGVIYKENFSSKDLMTWLYTALYEKKYITKDSVDDLWDLKETSVSIGHQTYSCKDKISIEKMNYTELSSIAIDTTRQEDGSFKRTISFQIPQKVLDQNGGKITNYFKGQNLSFQGAKDGKTAVITINADHFTDLAAKTRDVLHSDSSYGTTSLHLKKEEPFTFQIQYKEALDFSNFVQKNGTVPVTYTMNGKQIAKDSFRQKTLDFSNIKKQSLLNYEILTLWHNAKDIRRKFIFHMDHPYEEREIEKLKEAFSKPTISDIKIKGKTLSFLQEGSVKDCTKDLSDLFPGSSFQVSSKHSMFRGALTSFEDVITLKNIGNSATGTYTLASVSNDDSTKVSMTPEKCILAMDRDSISERKISRLANGNETLQILAQYKIKGNTMKLTYEGNRSVSYWISSVKIILPLLILILLSFFIYKKQNWICEQVDIVKNWIKEKKNNL